jgi:hypothetical protein
MEVDTGIKSMLLVVKAQIMDSLAWVGPDPGSWWEGNTHFLKLARSDTQLTAP